MPGSDDDVMQDADSTPNWTGRAKGCALLFARIGGFFLTEADQCSSGVLVANTTTSEARYPQAQSR